MHKVGVLQIDTNDIRGYKFHRTYLDRFITGYRK
jgi:hypothetical protein